MSAEDAVQAVLDIHRPVSPPSGKVWISGGTDPHCAGCGSGDPYDDEPWPCPTVQAIRSAL